MKSLFDKISYILMILKDLKSEVFKEELKEKSRKMVNAKAPIKRSEKFL